MQTMKAAILDSAPGGLHVEEIPIPEPKAGEVLVKVSACGICHTDLHVMKAEVAFPTPAVMGHEISGTVAALGPGVAGPPVGTKVVSAFIMPCGFCPACGAGRDDLCDSFFAMNRLKGTLYDGTTRLRRKDGTPIAMYSMAGLAEYSARPAIEYIAIGAPSRRRRRVVPSYSVPFRRFIAKKLSHRSSRPAPHGVQNPHGMMNAHTTLVPTAGPFTPGPSAATVPEISCPITAGVGNATSAFMTCRSVWHTPHAFTFTRISPAPGSGIGISSMCTPPGALSRMAALIVCIRNSPRSSVFSPGPDYHCNDCGPWTGDGGPTN